MNGREPVPDSADVVIVGGGIMGTSACYFLSERTDLDILLLEKNSIASGATGNSSAILRHHYGDREVYSQSAWWSHRFYLSFEDRLGEPLSHGEAPLVKFAEEGTDRADHVDDGYEVLQALDIPVSRYDAGDFDRLYPMFELDGVDFGVSDDVAGYSDGTDAANGFARAARRNGATIETGVRVTDVRESDEGTVQGVETDRGAVSCETVILTAGCWSVQLAKKLGVDLPITPTLERVFLLDPPSSFTAEHLDRLPSGKPPGLDDWYMRQDFGARVLVATHHSYDEQVDDPDGIPTTPPQSDLLELVDVLEDVAPGLADSDVVGQYCGVYTNTPDHDFIIDRIGPDGCFIACGFSGHGFKHGPSVGRVLSDLVVDGATEFLDVDTFSIDRFDD